MGRTVMDEDPSTGFGGVYIAQLSDEGIRDAVEKTDLAIMIGAIRSDLNTGLWSSKIKTKNIVELCVVGLFALSKCWTWPDPRFLPRLQPLDLHASAVRQL